MLYLNMDATTNQKIYNSVRYSYLMEITKLSTKGQVVIPEEFRKDLETGTAFAVTRKDDLIVLKKLKGFNSRELEELNELQKIWKDIDQGRAKSYSKKDFMKELESW